MSEYRRPQREKSQYARIVRRKEAITMHFGIRYSTLVLFCVLLLCFGVSLSAQQIRYEDFSQQLRFLQLNGNASFQNYQGNAVLRMTDGNPVNPEAGTVYFQDTAHVQGVGKQQVADGFTTWFAFRIHNETCCSPGDGITFIVQNSSATDPSYGASGFGFRALGAGGGMNQAGALGYAGINNNLVIEFDIQQDPWDPTSNHIAIQTCGPATNTPVHLPGSYTIGNNNNVQSCLLSQAAIDSNIPMIGGTCSDGTCTDGSLHNLVIQYMPPSGNQPGALQIWFDPTFIPGTHTPTGPPIMNIPYNIVYDAQNNPLGLNLDTTNCMGDNPCGYAWVGFTASQPPNGGTQQDIFGWEFTPHATITLQQQIQPGGMQTLFSFGGHETGVTYPMGFQNPNGILMSVTATPVDRHMFYQTRLLGTQFANEQCIVYSGTGGGQNPIPSGNCIVYSYTCQDQSGNSVVCPQELQCSQDQTQCIIDDTTFYTSDQVTSTNADYLENDAIGSNNWFSIFTSYMSDPLDGTTSGRGSGFGGGGDLMDLFKRYRTLPTNRHIIKLAGQAPGADIVATFNPSLP